MDSAGKTGNIMWSSGRSPGRMEVLGKPGMLRAERAGSGAGGRKAAPAPGSAEKRRKSGGKARGHREEARSCPGARCPRCPRREGMGHGRGTETRPSPAANAPGGAAGPGVPWQPRLGTRSLVGDPKRGEQDLGDTPLVAVEVALPLSGCVAGL